eukprot:2809751-Pyramimonas_sp.AAC.1
MADVGSKLGQQRPNTFMSLWFLTDSDICFFLSAFRRPETAQEPPKIAQRSPKDRPRGLQDGPKTAKEGPKTAPKSPQDGTGGL